MLKKQIEALLFLSNKPLTIKKIADLVERSKTEVETVLEVLKQEYNIDSRGLKLIFNADEVQMATAPEAAATVEKFLKEEQTGEMTRPQLETLTIIAYRGPITKMELEQIRGVNCSLILRNLMIRGLVEETINKKIKTAVYQVTLDFIRHLGLTSTTDLPDFERLSQSETLVDLLNRDEKDFVSPANSVDSHDKFENV